MAVSRDSTTRLGCGRDIDEVWTSLDLPLSSHEQHCVFCQEARTSLARLAQVTAELHAADDADPGLEPGPQVLSRVMEIARSEIRRGRRLPFDEPTEAGGVSDLTVSEQTVAAAVRRAADSVTGIEVRRCRVELGTGSPVAGEDGAREDGGEPSPAAVDVPDSYRSARPSRVSVVLQVSMSASVAIPEAGREIRRAVREAVTREVGMHVVSVDIDVRDIHDA